MAMSDLCLPSDSLELLFQQGPHDRRFSLHGKNTAARLMAYRRSVWAERGSAELTGLNSTEFDKVGRWRQLASSACSMGPSLRGNLVSSRDV